VKTSKVSVNVSKNNFGCQITIIQNFNP